MLPNFFCFQTYTEKGRKKKRKEGEVLFTFHYLALLKLKCTVLHAAYTLPFVCFSWVGNFWNSEGRGKTILKTINYFIQGKAEFVCYLQSGVKKKKYRSKCKCSFKLLKLLSLYISFLFRYVKTLILINKQHSIKYVSKH